MNEWISIKQCFPLKYEPVLVTDGKNICIHYNRSPFNFSDEKDEKRELRCCLCPYNHAECEIIEGTVTHWMELPRLPNE